MNTKITSLLAILAGAGAAFGQVATTPVGYTTQTLTQNTFNLVGFNVLNAVVVSSTLTGVSGASVTDSEIDFSSVLTADKMYTLEVTSGTAAGTVQEFDTWASDTVTLPSAISGLAIGDSYSVRLCPTLQEVFPVGLLTGSFFATTADKVWVPSGPGTYTKYWYKTLAPAGWHTTTTGSNDAGAVTEDIPLVNIDGILVEKKGATTDLVLSGEVKLTGSNVFVETGLNLISINPPVGLTLFTSGLQDDVAASIFPTTADIVWVPDGAGSYTKYWYKTGSGWHTTSTGSNDLGIVNDDVDLPPSIFVQRKSSAKVMTLDVPAGY